MKNNIETLESDLKRYSRITKIPIITDQELLELKDDLARLEHEKERLLWMIGYHMDLYVRERDRYSKLSAFVSNNRINYIYKMNFDHAAIMLEASYDKFDYFLTRADKMAMMVLKIDSLLNIE